MYKRYTQWDVDELFVKDCNAKRTRRHSLKLEK